jgi:hypothetical protein
MVEADATSSFRERLAGSGNEAAHLPAATNFRDEKEISLWRLQSGFLS